jgi:cobyrinic acid a,c-diamide synthase
VVAFAGARLFISGQSGDSGKTFVSTGLARALVNRGLRVAPFKKGPDYIDSAWLGAAAGRMAYNLDSYMMPGEIIRRSFVRQSRRADIALVEGNRGLFDGVDADGTHSTAELAKVVHAPVILLVDACKATRTLAAGVLGCRMMDPDLDLAGVVLNRVGSARHEAVAREAIRRVAGLPVLGAIPRIPDLDLPCRHLGLITVVEHPRAQEILCRAAEMVEQHTDVNAILAIARAAVPLEDTADMVAGEEGGAEATGESPRVRIGWARDEAFSFYYPENLSSLEEAGAELVPFSPISDESLPACDAVYLGGGFPELYAAAVARNRCLRATLRRKIAEGLPVWAECGGVMYLARELVVDGVAHPMVGALPVTIEQTSRPQGHGYVEARVDAGNPFLPEGLTIRGHEFHYSRVRGDFAGLPTILSVSRGVGLGDGRDGIRAENLVACYTHFHALGLPEWAPGMVRAAAGEAP